MTPFAGTDTPPESTALATTSMLRVTVTTGTSFEGHVKCFLDDSLPGAFACMQGRRPGHGGPREQPSPPPGSLLGQGPYSSYQQVHGEGVQVTKGQHLPSGGRYKWDPGRDFLMQSWSREYWANLHRLPFIQINELNYLTCKRPLQMLTLEWRCIMVSYLKRRTVVAWMMIWRGTLHFKWKVVTKLNPHCMRPMTKLILNF